MTTKLKVPPEILRQHLAVLGKTRSGKSSVMRGLVEHLIGEGKPVCIVDPKGDWWGIKLAADGKHEGLSVVIFGGEHADIPIDEHSGHLVAELFATGNRSCLIDLGGWTVGSRTRFWIDFASTLFKLTKGNRWLAVDEIHNFAPKGKVFDAEAGKALHWTNRLASEGLGKGLAMIFASQRPQKVHNDTLTSAETLIAMRVIHPSDRGAISEWIKGCGDSEGDEVLGSLAQMLRGEGWTWSPEIGFGPKRIQFPMFATYDSFRPQTVEDSERLTGWAEVDLDEIRKKFSATIEKSKADDPKELKKQIIDLKKQLEAAGKGAIDEKRLEQIRDQDYNRGYADGQQSRVDEILKLDREVVQLRQMIQKVHEVSTLDERTTLPLVPAKPSTHVTVRNHSLIKDAIDRNKPIIEKSLRNAVHNLRAGSGTDLPAGERACLIAIAQSQSETELPAREQITILTGYKRSSRDAYISRLAAKGLVDSPMPGMVRATPGGIKALGSDFEPLPTGQALQEYWLQRLPEGERKILKILCDTYPDEIHRQMLDERLNYKRSSRDAYLARLSTRRLVIVKSGGHVAASDHLF